MCVFAIFAKLFITVVLGNNTVLTLMMVARCAGLALPSLVAALFKTYGAMTIFYTLVIAVTIMPITLFLTLFIIRKYTLEDESPCNLANKIVREELA